MSSAGLPAPTAVQLQGEELYGDDFTAEQVERWFREEAEGYSEMSGESVSPANYGYHELNRRTLLRYIPVSRRFRHALGFGSGYGVELAPLAHQIDRLTVIESGHGYGLDPALRMPTTFARAQPSGNLALGDADADLVTCFGVLMYIPNVSHVLSEFARVLEPGGVLLLREPVTSLGGNWGTSRRGTGLTSHARGVPRAYFRRQLAAHGLVVERETFHSFPLVGALWKLGPVPYNSRALTSLDLACCRLFARRLRYHAVSRWQKIRPTEVAILARRG
jgi:SAM-dependent methyltransferase